MKSVTDREAYGYRRDPSVPEFDDSGPVVFMDGDCVLCTAGARIICKLDKAKEFKICPIQSALGKAVLEYYGLEPSNPDTWLYLAGGKAYTSLDAMIRAGWRLGGLGRVMALFTLFPRVLQDWIYQRIARSRYRLWGRTDMCALPDPDLHSRLIR